MQNKELYFLSARHKQPNQHHRDQRVKNIDVHRIDLLAKSLHHGVGGGIDVHDGDEWG